MKHVHSLCNTTRRDCCSPSLPGKRYHGCWCRSVLFAAFLTASPCALTSGPILLDDFESLSGWKAVTSHGDASKLTITSDEGKSGKAMLMEFSFLGHMGSAAAEKRLALPLPVNYQISFDIRGEAPVNNFIIRLMDSSDNVWVVMRSNFEFPRTWTKFVIKKHQIQYGWGPAGGGELHTLDRIMLMIDVVEGGKGKLWIDNLAIEPIEGGDQTAPRVTVSSSKKGLEPEMGLNGSTLAGWRSSGKGEREWLALEFERTRTLGGLVIDWDTAHFATAFDVLLSENGKTWSVAYAVSRASGGRSYIFLKESEGKYLKLDLKASNSGKGYGISRLDIKGPEFSFSVNDFFGALAADAPRGFYPKYLLHEQSYWTVVGAAADAKEALVNEQGMTETDKQSFSLEPFLYIDGRLVTWNDVKLIQSLEKQYLPIPSVHWDFNDRMKLTVKAVAAGPPDKSVLLVKYSLENVSPQRTKGKFFVSVRPFQVNPPWQTFTIVGGAARVDSISYRGVLKVNDRYVVPLSRSERCGVAAFDQGHITEYLRHGNVPTSKEVHDHFGYASAALQYDFDLQAGETKAVVVAVPFHERPGELDPDMGDQQAVAYFDRKCAESVRFWDSKLNKVEISLPSTALPIESTIKSNLGYILINADGVALQPGSRSYERSWLRDGALTSTALLQMGIVDEVRNYIDWYATYQSADGAIPAIVEARGADPTPEHDSHGEFIYAIMQYFHFTHDTTWLRAKWSGVVRTVRHIQALRAQRKTDLYKNGTPEQRACYGLVPESISHEGYTPKPMHSYWDDFFIMRGLKDAARMAELVGTKDEAREFALERDDFRTNLYASMRLAMQNKRIAFIPGCVELGDFSGLSTTIGITPCDELGFIPDTALKYTFDESYRMFRERKNNSVVWDAYLPYEARFIGAYVYLDQSDRAYDFLEYLMRDRRPAAWNGWAEVVWKEYTAPKSIGDMPHSWAASDFIRSVRSMFVYEREIDDALVVGAGIPEVWLNDTPGVEVKGLPTYYGHLNYTMKRHDNRLVLELSGDLSIPKGNIEVRSPLKAVLRSVGGDGVMTKRGAIVDRLPARLEFTY
jgi:hypothetical protein